MQLFTPTTLHNNSINTNFTGIIRHPSHFGYFFEKFMFRMRFLRTFFRAPGLFRPWKFPMGSETAVTADERKFQVNLDVKQFKPEELSVRIVNECILIEGQHEEDGNEGVTYREFFKQYCIPNGYDVTKIVSKMSSDGVLTVTVPKLSKIGHDDSQDIPISLTGQPHKLDE